MYQRKIYPIIFERDKCFPGGESAHDLQERAERAIGNIVMPHVWDVIQSGRDDRIALVSHGLCISELVAALLRKDERVATDAHGKKWTGLRNTAWTRVKVTTRVSKHASLP